MLLTLSNGQAIDPSLIFAVRWHPASNQTPNLTVTQGQSLQPRVNIHYHEGRDGEYSIIQLPCDSDDDAKDKCRQLIDQINSVSVKPKQDSMECYPFPIGDPIMPPSRHCIAGMGAGILVATIIYVLCKYAKIL